MTKIKIFNYYKEIQKEAAFDAQRCTCHFLVMKDGNPEPYGSGVFIEVDNVHFLITAAHVVEGIEKEIYVGISKHEMIVLGGEVTKNVAACCRKDDKIDLLIVKLSPETIEKLGGNYDFLKQNELGINHNLQSLPMYTSVGYPASRSKYNPFKKELKSKPFIYTTIPAEGIIYEELKCVIPINIIVHYDKDKVQDYSTGKIMKGPDPFGISGSGLWYTPIQEKARGEVIDKKLIAIMTEWPIKNRKYWIGTRIDAFTEVIRLKYNLKVEPSKFISFDI